MTARIRWALLLGTCAGILLLWVAPPMAVRWRAEETAKRFAMAMFRGDTVALAQLSARGSADTASCLRDYWPAEFWERNRRPPVPRPLQTSGDEFGFELVGDALANAGGHAVYEVYVARKRPERITRIFAEYRLGVWTPEVRACLQP